MERCNFCKKPLSQLLKNHEIFCILIKYEKTIEEIKILRRRNRLISIELKKTREQIYQLKKLKNNGIV